MYNHTFNAGLQVLCHSFLISLLLDSVREIASQNAPLKIELL